MSCFLCFNENVLDYLIIQLMNQNLKKQGLLLLVSMYINGPTYSLLQFMKAHQLHTKGLFQNLHSNAQKGLHHDQVELNMRQFGSNIRQLKQNTKWIILKKMSYKQLVKVRNLLIFFMVLFEIIFGNVYKLKEMERAGSTTLIVVVLSFIIKIGARFNEKFQLQKQKNSKLQKKYHVYRQNEKVQVFEKEIVVGDILLVDFAQPIPVTGLLVSDDEGIEMDQNLYGKNVRPKQTIQQCLHIINNKNQLQLRIETEMGRLPSPIILRGTTCRKNFWFRMLVLCVQQVQILEKCSKKIQKQRGVSVIEDWINSTTKLMRKITSSIITIIVFFHVLAIIFKTKGIPKGKADILANVAIQSIHTFLCITLLIDPSLLKDLLRAKYTKVATMLRSQKDLDKYLAVEQIFLTQQSVFKYDKIAINKVALADLQQPVDAHLLPALKPQETYPLFYQIVAGVNLSQDLFKPKNTRILKNSITHKISYQQRIFTSLYTPQKDMEKVQPDSIDQIDSIGQLLKIQERMNTFFRKSNQVNPSFGNQKQLQALRSQNKLQEKRTSSKKQQQEMILKEQNNGQEKYTEKLHLDDYLSKNCHFSAKSIVQGINVLAKKRSRTYSFQSYSSQRLDNVVNIWSASQFRPKNHVLIQKLRQSIRLIEQMGMRVYLIGFQQGAYPKKYMSNLFGAVGVDIKSDLQISSKLNMLEKSGINSTFIISQIQQQASKLLIKKDIQDILISRSWVNTQKEFVNMQKIVQKGGRAICQTCLTTTCKCKPKTLQLANPQGFLQITHNIKCIWDVDQDDRNYLELGFSQLNMGVTEINGFELDTKQQLDMIFEAQLLISALEEDFALWLAWLVNVVLCLFPFNYLTFNNIFSHPQLYFAMLYFQALILRHQFAGSSSIFFQAHSSNGKKKRQMFGLSLKIDLFIFIVLLIAGFYIVLNYPKFFSNSYRQQFPNYDCSTLISFYHNSRIAPVKCIRNNQSFIYYQKAPTFIYLYFLFAFTFRSAVNIIHPLSKYNILYHVTLLATLLGLTYFCSQWLQLSTINLSLNQLGVCLGIAISVVFLGFIFRFIILKLKKGQTFQFELSLGSKRKDSTQLLKQYKFGKTSILNLEKQEFIQKALT